MRVQELPQEFRKPICFRPHYVIVFKKQGEAAYARTTGRKQTMNGSVLILGATSSIARAIASRLAADKTDLVLAGRNVEDLKLSASDLTIRYQIKAEPARFDAEDFD